MRALLALATVAIAAPLAAAPSLAGVSDDETEIRSGQIEEFHRGHGDVLFVRDRENKWFRLQLNKNCIDGRSIGESLSVRQRDITGRINRLSEINFYEYGIRCNVDSIRRSAAPPQVDSHSPITLD